MKAEKWLFECRNLEEKYELVAKEKEVRLRCYCPSPTLPIKAKPISQEADPASSGLLHPVPPAAVGRAGLPEGGQ